METSFETKKRHDGYNVKRLREILGVKQEDLADRMNLSQQTISKIEQKDTIEGELLEKIAQALNIPVNAIKEFSEEATVNIIANTFHDDSMSGWYSSNYKCTFNPLDKVIELYERMLQAEKEKVALLEEVLKSKN